MFHRFVAINYGSQRHFIGSITVTLSLLCTNLNLITFPIAKATFHTRMSFKCLICWIVTANPASVLLRNRKGIMTWSIKGTVSRYKRLEVTIFETFLNQPQTVTNDDVVRPQTCTRYIGYEQIAIAYRRLERSYYSKVHEMNPPDLNSFSDT